MPAHDCGNHVSDDPHQPLLPRVLAHKKLLVVLLSAIVAIVILGIVIALICLYIPVGDDISFSLVIRRAWGARPPKNRTSLATKPPSLVVIIHTASQVCLQMDTCCQQVRNIQSEFMDHFNYSDIPYNFLVGGDGRTYEGRGWDVQGAFSKLVNKRALGVAFIGNFEYESPSERQLEEAKALLKHSVEIKQLANDYHLVGHKQVSATDSPGEKLFDIIKTWPHWEQCFMNTC